jgi:hypothetical protein
MAAVETDVRTTVFSALVQNDFGLEEFTYDAIRPNETGVPTNLEQGTEYALLTAEQSSAYWAGACAVLRATEPARLGAFAIMFEAHSGMPENIVFSLNIERHNEIIEQSARAGEA